VLADAPPALPGSPIHSYATTFNSQQHVNFLDSDGHVHELWYGSEWAHNDLTVLAGAPSAAAGRKIVGYETTFNNQQHVNFLDSDGHVHELWFGSEWAHNDLSSLASGSPAASESRVMGYQTTFNAQQHVNYLDAEGHVYELLG
jgi:zona occludens toxin (predicted ATPase)